MSGSVIPNFDSTSLTEDKINSLPQSSMQCNSLYEYIVACGVGTNYFTYEYNGNIFLSCVSDIRFDYVHNEIFIPFYVYDYLTDLSDTDKHKLERSKVYPRFGNDKVGYNQHIVKLVVFKNSEFIVDNLRIIHSNFGELSLTVINCRDLKVRSDIRYDSAKVLFDKYVRSSFANKGVSYLAYNSSRFSSLTNAEISILKSHNLTWYSNSYTDIEYSEVRPVSYDDLSKYYDDSFIKPMEPFQLRRVDFEAYLMAHLVNKVYWYGFTRGSITRVTKGVDFFCKYKEHDFSIIIRKEWLNNY